MKLNKYILFLLLAASGVNSARAQLVTDNIFLQGRWLEVAVAPNGAWGNTVNVPAGYHAHTGSTLAYTDPVTGVRPTGNGMDFSTDIGHDGWTTGSPADATNCCFYGAYFLPGTPFDGWAIQMNGVRSDAYYTSSGFALGAGATAFTGTNVAYNYTPGSTFGPYMESTMAGTWSGSYSAGGGTISIRSTNRVDTNATWDKVNVTFKNTGATTVTGLYYLVTGDPDNDQVTTGGSFPTNNHISYQGDAQHRVEVNARPPSLHQDAFSGLATKDCRALAIIYQSWPSPITIPLSDMWAGTTTGTGWYTSVLDTTTLSLDIAYGLVYNLGDLAPGDSTTIAFAWIFTDTSAIDSAFPRPQLNVNGNLMNDIDTFDGCGLVDFPVNIVNGEWGVTNWKWSPTTGLASSTGISNTITMSALSGETVYTITGTDTGSCNKFEFLLTIPSCFYTTSNSPDTNRICVDDTLKLKARGDSTGATYVWYGPTIVGPLRGFMQYQDIPHISMADTGWYYCIKTVGGVNDTDRTHVMLKPKPIINATYNAPVCSGNTLLLYSNPDSVGETWQWTGPNGFSSTLSDPGRPFAPTAYSGLYTVVATFNGCVDSSIVNVVVDSTPAVPTLSSNSFVCEGDTLKLFADCVTPAITYSWAGPSGYTSFDQNPVIPVAPLTANGTYTVTVRRGTCTNSATIFVDVRPTPVPVLGTNAPVCSGTPLNLSTTATAGSTFSWDGPLGFTSGVQFPTIDPAITANSGTYSVVVTLNGCPSDLATITVAVDSTPEVPVVSCNSPGVPGPTLCEGDTLKLFAHSASAGVGYEWGGPSSFTSTEANPIIVPATPASSGLYSVVVSIGACSVSASTTATITPTPLLTVSSNTPVCSGSGDSILLTATSNPGAVFNWTGPYTFFSAAQNPIRTPVNTEYGGVYHVTTFFNGCYKTLDHTVVVNPTPSTPWVKWLTYCQYYDAPYLQAGGDNILWYSTSDLSGTSTVAAPKPQTDAVGVTYYYVNQTVNNCPSAMDSIRVRVDPVPLVTVSNDTTVCPRDSVVLTAVNTDAVAFFRWYPDMYLSDTGGAVVVARPETNTRYEVVTTNMYGCTDTSAVTLTVKADAVIHLEDSVMIYPGESYQITPTTNCTQFSWTPSGGLSAKFVSNPLAAPPISTKYVVTGVTEWGCIAKDSINVNVNTEAILSLPNAFAPGRGINDKFRVIRRGLATLRYFRIYNRWGNLIFETTNIDEGWDGTLNGEPQPVGVYVYEVSAVSKAGTVFKKQGNVTLLR